MTNSAESKLRLTLTIRPTLVVCFDGVAVVGPREVCSAGESRPNWQVESSVYVICHGPVNRQCLCRFATGWALSQSLTASSCQNWLFPTGASDRAR
jgi:hypothetical protein